MTPEPPRLAFSHAEQRFIVKARSISEGWEIRGFPQARGTRRTRFVMMVPHEMVEDAQRRGAPDPVDAALRSVKDEMIEAIDQGEQLIETRQS